MGRSRDRAALLGNRHAVIKTQQKATTVLNERGGNVRTSLPSVTSAEVGFLIGWASIDEELENVLRNREVV